MSTQSGVDEKPPSWRWWFFYYIIFISSLTSDLFLSLLVTHSPSKIEVE
jgi:hypothetical protein